MEDIKTFDKLPGSCLTYFPQLCLRACFLKKGINSHVSAIDSIS